MKYYDTFPNIARDTETENKCNELINKGIEEVYVNKTRDDIILVEEGKEYLVYMYKNNLGDYWLMTGKNAVREYNSENNTILNNNTGQWEDLSEYIK